ncbi:MAG: Zn-ribbon domain-containing OB-fold protein [Thaumarchaeota archaeon]|nr:Zn-ribbon domain-containing OB-fold protein [Nitrososphaerota archaeon]
MSSKISVYPGVEITTEDVRSQKYLLTKYQTGLNYAWSSGVAMGRFLRGLKEKELWGRECDGCQRILVPPRMYCESCYRPTDRWSRLRDAGKVVTYSIAHVNSDASRRSEPILLAVMEIEGASPLMGILHLLGEVPPEKVRIGMKVEAVWRPDGERTGAITDILHFRPMTRSR